MLVKMLSSPTFQESLGTPLQKNTFFFFGRLEYKQIFYFKATKDLCVLGPSHLSTPYNCLLTIPSYLRAFAHAARPLCSLPAWMLFTAQISAWRFPPPHGTLAAKVELPFSCCFLSFPITSSFFLLARVHRDPGKSFAQLLLFKILQLE